MSEKSVGTPWRRCGGTTPRYIAIVDANDRYVVFQMADWLDDKEHGNPLRAPSYDEQQENAQLIVTAVNSHAELVAALENALDTLQCGQHLLLKYCPEHHWIPEHTSRIEQLRAALAHAKQA